tara:strand:+ start:99 stop:407 length:309 start_codon:yes stop_codon:yes gene_type:complete
MDELDILLRKNKLDILIIKASHQLEKKKDKVKRDGLETLVDILELIHELQDEIRKQRKQIAKLKYENAVSYKENAILKTKFDKYKHDLKKAELDSPNLKENE